MFFFVFSVGFEVHEFSSRTKVVNTAGSSIVFFFFFFFFFNSIVSSSFDTDRKRNRNDWVNVSNDNSCLCSFFSLCIPSAYNNSDRCAKLRNELSFDPPRENLLQQLIQGFEIIQRLCLKTHYVVQQTICFFLL
jgi:hypothetical protein